MAKSKSLGLTAKNLAAAQAALSRADEVMARQVATFGKCTLLDNASTPFHLLSISIIRQQLSIKAAETIQGRIETALPAPYTHAPFTPEGFLAVTPEVLRAAGLSAAKIRTLRELSTQVNQGELDFDQLPRQPDEEVLASLTAVWEIGRWTAEMFLIFALKRPDVLSLGDAGLQRAAKLLYGPNVALAEVGEFWRPYRSVASWYLWRTLDKS